MEKEGLEAVSMACFAMRSLEGEPKRRPRMDVTSVWRTLSWLHPAGGVKTLVFVARSAPWLLGA
jgi:hypothetical protein